MKEKDRLEINLEKEGIDFSLKHFIYLDKNKLHSYSSQLLGGIIQSTKLVETEGTRKTKSPDEEYSEILEEIGGEGELTAGAKNVWGGVSGKGSYKKTTKNGLKKGINNQTEELLSSYMEDIIEHDDGYLKLEEILISKGILKEITSLEELEKYSSLVKITGVCRFVDWDSIIEVFKIDSIINNFLENEQQQEQLSSAAKGFKQNSQQKKSAINTFKDSLNVIKAFSIGSVTVNTKVSNLHLIGSINQEYLRLTRDQLRSAYIMPGDVEMIIVGFIPRRNMEKITFPGLVGMLDLTGFWEFLGGEIDVVIEPIAIYTEIKH
ncbi:DUF6414 family protein [Anabaena sp. WFMT]|uniref:DUF6414 family protein n=1 Tax=Anabaena sp. WFMT TaxID=3449730 RepID=UPI003F26F836